MGNQTLLIDGDIVVHRCCWATQNSCDFKGGDEPMVIANLQEMLTTIDDFIKNLLHATNTDKYILALSCPFDDYHRHKVATDYKANRLSKPGPILKAQAVAHVRSEHPSVTWKNLEADDTLGILMTDKSVIPEGIIATTDKDLQQIPGLHWNWGRQFFVNVTPQMGERFFYLQTLTGDRVDNIQGIPGIGPAKAEKILALTDNTQESMWRAVLGAYNKYFGDAGEEQAIATARLVRILRAGEYSKEGEVTLWEPPKLW